MTTDIGKVIWHYNFKTNQTDTKELAILEM